MKSAGRALRLLICVALFCIDVHVRAEEVEAPECWAKGAGECPIKAFEGRRNVHNETLSITMSEGSLVDRRKDGVMELVDGRFYVETTTGVRFGTPYAKFWCANECRALIERDLKRVTIKSLMGDWRIQRTGENTHYVLAAGLQTLVGEVTNEGVAQMEFPQSLPWITTVKEWAALYPRDQKHFKTDVGDFRIIWHQAVSAVSDLHEKTVSREVASHNEELAQERARQKAREKEDAGLREIFRQKNYLNP